MISLPVIDKKVLVFNLDDVKQLRNYGILGVLIGTLPVAPQQNIFLNLPLELSIYEVIWLVENGLGRLVDNLGVNSLSSNENGVHENYCITENDSRINETILNQNQISLQVFLQHTNHEVLQNYKVYRHIKNKGFHLLPGLRFGGLFVAYPGDPLRYHSHLIINRSSNINCLDLVTGGRLATGVKKSWVIADTVGEEEQDDVMCFSIEWAGFG